MNRFQPLLHFGVFSVIFFGYLGHFGLRGLELNNWTVNHEIRMIRDGKLRPTLPIITRPKDLVQNYSAPGKNNNILLAYEE